MRQVPRKQCDLGHINALLRQVIPHPYAAYSIQCPNQLPTGAPALAGNPIQEKKVKELINQVTKKTGLTTDQATAAVNTVISYLKSKLPSAVAGQIDNLLNGGAGGMGAAQDAASKVAGAVGGVLGKK